MVRIVVIATVAALAAAGCGERVSGFAVADAPEQASEERTYDGWTVDVTVDGPDLGPLVVSARVPDLAPPSDAEPWLQHELVFENHGKLPLTFADTRTSAFVGPRGHRALLVADEGCGYGRSSAGGPVDGGLCATYLDLLTVRPGRAETRTITLFKELRTVPSFFKKLRPMPLVDGTYVFEKTIRYAPGTRAPSAGSGRTAVLRIVYELAPADAARAHLETADDR